jgi:hypothetical protein
VIKIMDFKLGSQIFSAVRIPLLWGTRAVLSHPSGALSVIDIGGTCAIPEIVSNIPWHQVEYSEKEDGFVIYRDDIQSYFYSPSRKLFRDLNGLLPECEITSDYTRIGTNKITGGMVAGSGVGIGVSENGFFIGGPIPPGLAELKM